MTRILFLHHQQRRPFREEPGYHEIFKVFQASGLIHEPREFVYQTLLATLAGLHHRLASDQPDPFQRQVQAWASANGDIVVVLDQILAIERPDVIINITSFGPQSLHPQVFSLLRERGHRFKVASIYFDVEENDALIVLGLKETLAHGDLIVIADDAFAAERLALRQPPYDSAVGTARVLFAPCAVDPDLFKPLALDKTRDVAIFGSSEGQRVGFIDDLSRRYGARFAHLGGLMAQDQFLSLEDYVREINRTRIIVNTQTSPLRDQVKGRIKEVLACGGFLLEQDSPNARRFLDGSGVVLFTDLHDLHRKIDHYLTHDEERAAIAAHARAWVLARHTPRPYVERVMAELGLEARFHGEAVPI